MLKTVIACILVILTFQSNENSCVFYDDTPESVQMIQTRLSSYTSENVNDQSFLLKDITTLPNCTHYAQFNASTQIYFNIQNPASLVNFTSSDPPTQQIINFVKYYNGSICANPPTQTISIFCNVYIATQPIATSVFGLLYPRINNKTLDDPVYFIENLRITKFINYHATFNVSSTYSFFDMFPHTSGGINSLKQTLEPFHTLVNNYRNNEHNEHVENLKVRFKQLVNHLALPFKSVINLFYRKDVHHFVNKHIENFASVAKKTASVMDSYIYELKTFNIQPSQKKAPIENLKSYLDQYTQHRHNSKPYLHYHLSAPDKWNNLADPGSTINLGSPVDLYNFAGSFVSWLFHINNEYNTTGCLGKGFPHVPEVNPLCKKITFVAPEYGSFWPVGFDPYNPQCVETYYNPITYVKSLIYIPSYYSGFGKWLLRHDGLAVGLSWAVYDYHGTQNLPPNMLPCMFWNFLMPLLLISVVFAALACCGISLKVAQKTMEVVLKEDAGVAIPDLTKILPKPEGYNGLEELNNVSSAFSNLQSKASNIQPISKPTPTKIPKIPKLPKIPIIKLK